MFQYVGIEADCISTSVVCVSSPLAKVVFTRTERTDKLLRGIPNAVQKAVHRLRKLSALGSPNGRPTFEGFDED